MTPRAPADDGAALTAMLKAQRWFGAKDSALRDVALRDVVPLSWPGAADEYAVARVDVVTEDGPSTYQIFFARGDDRFADALADAAFRRGLACSFERGATFEHAGTRWIVEREGRAPFAFPADADVTLGSAQQSNTSLVVGGAAILKLYRRLEPGVQPDLEVTRFLTVERDFGHVPALLGSIRFEDADGSTAAGLMQEYVRGAQEAWTLAVAAARSDAAGALAFAVEAERIGAVTRAMHEALASGAPGTAFESRAASSADVRAWAASVRETIAGAMRALRRSLSAGSVPERARADVEAVAAADERWARWVDDAAATIEADAGVVSRTHGDYHLGQVLRSETGRYLVIDFEGEPARPLRERRAPQSPLRDVAGMLRSIDYAAAVGGETSAEDWRVRCRAAFLRGYETGARSDAGVRWSEGESMARLIALFECEKVFYELRYELGHRPDWLWIPLHGVAALTT